MFYASSYPQKKMSVPACGRKLSLSYREDGCYSRLSVSACDNAQWLLLYWRKYGRENAVVFFIQRIRCNHMGALTGVFVWWSLQLRWRTILIWNIRVLNGWKTGVERKPLDTVRSIQQSLTASGRFFYSHMKRVVCGVKVMVAWFQFFPARIFSMQCVV